MRKFFAALLASVALGLAGGAIADASGGVRRPRRSASRDSASRGQGQKPPSPPRSLPPRPRRPEARCRRRSLNKGDKRLADGLRGLCDPDVHRAWPCSTAAWCAPRIHAVGAAAGAGGVLADQRAVGARMAIRRPSPRAAPSSAASTRFPEGHHRRTRSPPPSRRGVVISEYIYVVFQGAFAAITVIPDPRRLRRAHQDSRRLLLFRGAVVPSATAGGPRGVVLGGPMPTSPPPRVRCANATVGYLFRHGALG